MTSPLQINRYDRLVRRLGNIVGESAIVTGVLPDVFPVIDVEKLATDGWALAGWRPAMGGGIITASAGNNAKVQFTNPAGSGSIAVIETVQVSNNFSGGVGYNIHDALLSVLAVSDRWRDRRFATLNRPVCKVRVEDSLGLPIVAPMSIRLLANTTYDWMPPQGFMTLIPGSAVAFQAITVATQLNVNFWWRERPIEPAEENI